MKRAWILLALVAAVATAGLAQAPKGKIVKFRLVKDPTATVIGRLTKPSQEGFTLQPIGPNPSTRHLKWKDLIPEDSSRLRIELKLELSEEEKLGLMQGHRIWLRGSGYEDGLIENEREGSDYKLVDGNYLLKQKGILFRYPKDRVNRVEEIELRENQVFSKEEAYAKALTRRAPSTAQEHREVADFLYDSGNFAKARDHYRQAVEMDASLAESLADRMVELEQYARHEEVREVIQNAKYKANIRNDFDGAIAILKEFMRSHPQHARVAEREIGRVEARRQYRLHIEFMYRKHKEADRAIERFLYKRPDLAQARAWVTSDFPKQVQEKLMRDMDLSKEQFKAFMDNKGRGALHWAGYWAGSFIMSKRASIGKSTKNRVAGDPEGWWTKYNQVGIQKNWLKAYAAERLPQFFEVVMVRNADCDRCGGTGKRKVGSLTPVDGGKHSWKETCPRCFGAGKDRSVGYR